MEALAPVDLVIGAILGIAALRGLFLGLLREAFSIASLGAACVTVRLLHERAGEWVFAASEGRIGAAVAPWLGGLVVAVITIALVVLAGRMLRRGVRWAGLGWADRAGGAVLGVAEGLLVAVVLLVVGATVLGRDHPLLESSQSFAWFEQLERAAGERPTDVAAPPIN